MGMDLVIPRRKETGDESLASFMRRRLGPEALDLIAEPMMASIYTPANPEKLSMQTPSPMFLEMEQKMAASSRPCKSPNVRPPRKPKPERIRSQKRAVFHQFTRWYARISHATGAAINGRHSL